MTITTLILLLATGILTVSTEDSCYIQNKSIISCCDLGSKFFMSARSTKPSSGVYLLNNFCGDECIQADAYCDTINGGGGWLVVQRRQDGSVDFNRIWVEYEDGFGTLTGEFWYGLRALHCLTGQGGWEMRMDITLVDGRNIFLQYKQFKVASAKDKYKLTVGGFQGTTTDPMTYHNEMYFTTKDNDNDKDNRNCALIDLAQPYGGWWYNQCWRVNPNNYYKYNKYGIYLNGMWVSAQPPLIEIKIRPHNCI